MSRDHATSNQWDQRSEHTTEYHLAESIKNVSTATMGRIDRFGMQ